MSLLSQLAMFLVAFGPSSWKLIMWTSGNQCETFPVSVPLKLERILVHVAMPHVGSGKSFVGSL